MPLGCRFGPACRPASSSAGARRHRGASSALRDLCWRAFLDTSAFLITMMRFRAIKGRRWVGGYLPPRWESRSTTCWIPIGKYRGIGSVTLCVAIPPSTCRELRLPDGHEKPALTFAALDGIAFAAVRGRSAMDRRFTSHPAWARFLRCISWPDPERCRIRWPLQGFAWMGRRPCSEPSRRRSTNGFRIKEEDWAVQVQGSECF